MELRSVAIILAVGFLTLGAAPGTGVPSPTPEDVSREAITEHPRAAPSPVDASGPLIFGGPEVGEALRHALDDSAPEAEAQFPVGSPFPREFYFTRGIYTSWGRGFGFGRGGSSWAIDFPRADEIFLSFIDRLLDNLDAWENPHPVAFDDPELRRFPFLYALEVGRMDLSQEEIVALQEYLLAGGFLVIDDFWGEREWANFVYQMDLVLPGYEIIDLPIEHPLFTTFYEIEEILQVPNIRNGRMGGSTMECRGCYPIVKGILHDSGELMVVINFNTDLGDAWEWADDPYYPLRFSTYAYEMGVNMIVYGMSH